MVVREYLCLDCLDGVMYVDEIVAIAGSEKQVE